MRQTAKDRWAPHAVLPSALTKDWDTNRNALRVTPDSIRITNFVDATARIANGLLRSGEIDALLRIPYDDPQSGEAAVYVLAFAGIRRRDRQRVAHALLSVLADARLDSTVRAQAPEGISNHTASKQRALRRVGVTALRRHLKDDSPDVRFWSAFALGMLGAREARTELRALCSDTTTVSGFWTVGEEAADALDIIEGRTPPDRPLAAGAPSGTDT